MRFLIAIGVWLVICVSVFAMVMYLVGHPPARQCPVDENGQRPISAVWSAPKGTWMCVYVQPMATYGRRPYQKEAK